MKKEIEQAIDKIVNEDREDYLDFDLGEPKPKRTPAPTPHIDPVRVRAATWVGPGRLDPSQIQVGSEYIAHGEAGETDRVEILLVEEDPDYESLFNVEVRFLTGPLQGDLESWYLSSTDRMFEPVD